MDPDADVPIVSDDRERRSRGKPEGAFRSRRDGRDADSRRPVDGDEPSALDAGDRIVGDSGGRVPVDGPRSERERPDSSAGDSGEQRSRRGGRDRSSVAEFESGDVSRRNPGRYASTSRAELRVGDRREGEAEPGPDATRGSISRSRRDVSVRRSRDGLEDRQPSRRDVSSSPSHRRGLSREEEASPTGRRESIDAARGRGGEVQQSMASVAIPKPTLLRPKDAEVCHFESLSLLVFALPHVVSIPHSFAARALLLCCGLITFFHDIVPAEPA